MTTTINFEIAKLLKEKRFYKETLYFYKLNSDSKESEWNGEVLNWNSKLYEDLEKLAAPSIADVVMWLYEKHGIWIRVKPIPYSDSITHWRWEHMSTIYAIRNCGWEKVKDYMSSTEAYEAAIEYCLTKII